MDKSDDGIIAYIYPAVGTTGQFGGRKVIESNSGHPGYCPPTRESPFVDSSSRLGPPHHRSLDILGESNRKRIMDEKEHNVLEYEPCIKVAFDHVPKTRYGLRFGYGGDAELFLGFDPIIGRYHFALTFDDDFHLVIRDLGSTNGTTVVYGKTERGPWSDFSWIIGGSDFLEGVGSITVKLSQTLQFRIIVPRHDIQSKSYRDKVGLYRAGSADVEHLFSLDNVGLLSQARTSLPSGIYTPAKRPGKPATIQKKSGEGSFASVYRVWTVNTGEQYALKKPKVEASIDRDAWEREASIMQRINHKHVVSLISFSSPPKPSLRLEYMPEGTLSDHFKAHHHFSRGECGQILVQALDGLTYLHTSDPQIVHRDIKPNNILIQHRRPNDIFIKLADFGLAHEGDSLRTVCGTYLYLAPEIYVATAIQRSQREAYTALVDVWSLGVVLGELLCGLPKHGRQYSMGVGWCKTICEWVEMKSGVENDEMLSFVRDSMLRLQPRDRMTAADCYKGALALLAQNHELSCEADGGRCSARSEDEDEEAAVVLGDFKKFNDQMGMANGDSDVGGPPLSKYITDNPIHPPQATATMVQVGQFPPNFRNPEEGLSYESTLGEVLDGGHDGDSGTTSTIIPARYNKPQEGFEAGLIAAASEYAAPVEKSLPETMEWSKLDDDTETTAEQTRALIGNESQTWMSLKRSNAAMNPPSPKISKRVMKRHKTCE